MEECNYDVYECAGTLIDKSAIRFERTKGLLKVMEKQGAYFHEPKVYEDNRFEHIVVCVEVEVPQRPVNQILGYEIVQITVPEDDCSDIEVYALRNDFPLGLIHTNPTLPVRPVSLCLSETPYEERRKYYTPNAFLAFLRTWFSDQAKGELHREDQPLEPVFLTADQIVCSKPLCEHYYILDEYISNSKFKLFVDSDSLKYHDFEKKDDVSVYNIVTKPILNQVAQIGIMSVKDLFDFLRMNKDTTKLQDVPLQFLLSVFDKDRRAYIFLGIPQKRSLGDIAETYSCYFIEFEVPEDIQRKVDRLIRKYAKRKSDNAVRELYNLWESCIIKMNSVIFDFHSTSAAVYNGLEYNQSMYSLIGVGSLGAHILNNVVRMGQGVWHIFDHDYLLPHNLTRHVLTKRDIGNLKVHTLSQQMNQLVGTEVTSPHSFKLNERINEVDQKALAESRVIFDCSTSEVLPSVLTIDLESQISAPRVSLFFNPTASDLVVLQEDSARTRRMDALEMDYYWHIWESQELHNHLDNPQFSNVRSPRTGCREKSNTIRQDNIMTLSGIATNQVVRIMDADSFEASVSIWRLNQDMSVNKVIVPLSDWKTIQVGNWTLCYSSRLINMMIHRRKEALPNENGGLLVGSIDTQRKIIYLVGQVDAPEDSEAGPNVFIRGHKGTEECFAQISETTKHLRFLGDWHSHPDRDSSMSEQDQILHQNQVDEMDKDGLPATMMIVSSNEIRFIVNNEQIKTRILNEEREV